MVTSRTVVCSELIFDCFKIVFIIHLLKSMKSLFSRNVCLLLIVALIFKRQTTLTRLRTPASIICYTLYIPDANISHQPLSRPAVPPTTYNKLGALKLPQHQRHKLGMERARGNPAMHPRSPSTELPKLLTVSVFFCSSHWLVDEFRSRGWSGLGSVAQTRALPGGRKVDWNIEAWRSMCVMVLWDGLGFIHKTCEYLTIVLQNDESEEQFLCSLSSWTFLVYECLK